MTPTDTSGHTPHSNIDLQLFNETEEQLPVNESELRKAVAHLAAGEARQISGIEIVFVDETEIRRINRDFLNKEYVTDIITFPYHEGPQEPLEATLYCCAPRITEQAREFGETPGREFFRVVIHGVLHLCGYDDATEKQQHVIKQKENYYLACIIHK